MKHFIVYFLLTFSAFAQSTESLCSKIHNAFGGDAYTRGCIGLVKKYDLSSSVIKECLRLPDVTSACLLASGQFKATKQQVRECRYLSEGDAFAPVRCIELAGKKKLDPERIYECTSEHRDLKDQMTCIQRSL